MVTLIVDDFIGSLKVAVAPDFTETAVAPLAGLPMVAVGGV
jgi:hypothetical protein